MQDRHLPIILVEPEKLKMSPHLSHLKIQRMLLIDWMPAFKLVGYICFRLLEAILIIIGIISLLSIVTLSQEFEKTVAPNASSYLIAGKLLVTIHNWTFLLGPNLALGPSTLMMSYFLYESKLVPRFISVLGLVGGSLILTCALLVMFGIFLQVSAWGAILAIPVFAYEISLAVWLIVKGFNSSIVYSSFSLK